MTEASSVLKTIMMLAYLTANPHGDPNAPDAFLITSPAFKNHHAIPVVYTCEGSNISIPLKWRGVPKNTKSLALVMFDQDTPWPGFYHWEILDIPPNVTGLTPNASTHPPEIIGKNSWGNATYQGPCPPQGKHHYVIRLYALNTKLTTLSGASPLNLNRAMENHIIAWTQTNGTFTK